jgi:hypothetical protein
MDGGNQRVAGLVDSEVRRTSDGNTARHPFLDRERLERVSLAVDTGTDEENIGDQDQFVLDADPTT